MDDAGAGPKHEIASRLAREIGAQESIGREQDRLAFGDLTDDRFGVRRRHDDVGQRLHLRRAVDIGNRHVAGMFLPPRREG